MFLSHTHTKWTSMRKLLKVIDMFVARLATMVSWAYAFVKLIKLYTLICSFIY